MTFSTCLRNKPPYAHLIASLMRPSPTPYFPSDWLLDARHSGRHAVDEARAAHGHLLLGMRQLSDIIAMGHRGEVGGEALAGVTKGVAVSLPAYASKYGVLHLAAAGPQAETSLDAGVWKSGWGA